MSVAWSVSSCGTRYSFGLQRLNRYVVKGSVGGLNVDSIRIALVPRTQGEEKEQEVDVYPPGGDFQFPERIRDGTRFRVHVVSDPQQNTCTIKDSNLFVVQGLKNRVNVSCISHPVAIYHLINHLSSMIDEDDEEDKDGTGRVSAGAP